jgi:hypothetical protein
MDTWKVSDELSCDLGEVTKVVVKIVAGEVNVTAGPVAHIDVRHESGDEVTVELRNGTLFVAQPDPDSSPLDRFVRMLTSARRHRCTVAITAPPSCNVKVTTVSADVVASGFQGGTNLITVSGDVTLMNLRNQVDVKTVSGDIDAKDIAAALKLKTVSGDVGVVDGACRSVDTKTVSGDVILDLDLDSDGTYDVTTVSGDIAVRTTAEPSFSVEATTVSGRLVSDFGLGWPGQPGRKRISETVGNGGARLWTRTVSGDLRIVRGREAAA